jgi:hypothetical protein
MPHKDRASALEYERDWKIRRREADPDYFKRKKARQRKHETTCQACGKVFLGMKTARYCSRECSGRGMWRQGIANRFEPTEAKRVRYVTVRRPGHPMADKQGRVYEHRLVMADRLGRALLPSECVHHKNGNPRDNRVENLEIVTTGEHSRRHVSRPRR